MIKLNHGEVSADISNIRSSGQGLMSNKSEANLSKTNLITFKEYVEMFENYQSAITNYEDIVNQDVAAMETTVNEIVTNDQDIADQINNS
ncbi:TIGR04197 family type VII secretion effector [Staphylococcus arlettae]|uniref:TIGR04197 family type VII secretion effector n=1 Tax=Staphylococcus arlettae TaxID=29378 RepID=UPI000D1B4B04|nr:TIGR04197 family type VII secretion effector [Staphylococcus arlettae]PUZ32525.1 TIGR04197 family type VII secretion effector [Staphylococcus arlettae]